MIILMICEVGLKLFTRIFFFVDFDFFYLVICFSVVAAQNLNVAWSPCGTYLVYGDKEDSLSILDSRNLKTIKVETLKEEVNEFTFDPSGKYLYVAMGCGQLNIFS